MANYVPLSQTRFITDANLVGYYQLEGNGNDSSPAGANMSDNINVTYSVDYGRYSQGGTFNGINSKLSTAGVVMGNTNDFSMMAWVKPYILPQSSTCIVHNGADNGSAGNGYGLHIGNGAGAAGSKLSGLFSGVAWTDSGYTFPSASTWYHVAMTRTTIFGTAKTTFYVNGCACPTQPTTIPALPTSGSTIGNIHSNIFAISASIDDVAFFNRALSQKEIQEIYNGLSPTFGEYSPNSFTTGYWRFNGSGCDYSGNNPGLPTNNTSFTMFQDSKFGQGANLIFSSSQYVLVKRTTTSLDGSGTFTVSLWAKPTTLPPRSISYDLFSKDGSTGNFNTLIRLSTSAAGVSVWQHLVVTTLPSTVAYTAQGGSPVAGVWSNIVGVFDNTAQTVSIYADGLFLQKTTTGTVLRVSGVDTLIGGFSVGATSNWFNGAIDEVIVESRAWTQQMITQYYTMAKGRFASRMT